MTSQDPVFDHDNYLKWRDIHTKAFGDIFASAFSDHPEAQVHLTATLIKISQRRFDEAMPTLDFLESICERDFDEAAIYYFKGLTFELSDDVCRMSVYYEKLLASGISLRVPFAFHPYYRTAKFAQRNSECAKAVSYYRKALAFYDGTVPDKTASINAGQILYDVATVCLYMHHYEDCKKFLSWSKTYAPVENPQRDYVEAILYAVQGKEEESRKLLDKMHPFFKNNCAPTVEGILKKQDLHYCVVPQKRQIDHFERLLAVHKGEIIECLCHGDTTTAESILSDILTETFDFVKCRLFCRAELSGNVIKVYCKDSYINTLSAEYKAYFSSVSVRSTDWQFISVHELENFN